MQFDHIGLIKLTSIYLFSYLILLLSETSSISLPSTSVHSYPNLSPFPSLFLFLFVSLSICLSVRLSPSLPFSSSSLAPILPPPPPPLPLSYKQTQVYTRTSTYTETHPPPPTHTHTEACACAHAHTHTHTRARTHTHTHTHTHAIINIYFFQHVYLIVSLPPSLSPPPPLSLALAYSLARLLICSVLATAYSFLIRLKKKKVTNFIFLLVFLSVPKVSQPICTDQEGTACVWSCSRQLSHDAPIFCCITERLSPPAAFYVCKSLARYSLVTM